MEKRYIIALDEGTTSARALVYDCKKDMVVNKVSKTFPLFYPKPGWVEQNPEDIWYSQVNALKEAVSSSDILFEEIISIGITNQRETVILWDKVNGNPVYNAIVWQCRRTSGFCEELINNGLSETILKKTGLVTDAYFSASKIKWIFDNVSGVKELAAKNRLCAGTVDTYLIWKLTGGKKFVTDYSNASRTMLFNINTLKWDRELLGIFGINENILPQVVSNTEIIGETNLFGTPITLAGIAGDQQSALFGQKCFETGMAKNTYGTGCFLLMNTGNKPVFSNYRMLTTVAWHINNVTTYALEGSIFNAGSSISWLIDELKLINSPKESEELALSVSDTSGVYMVPAFSGLGTPYWDMKARGVITGLTRSCTKSHIVRATLESMAYSIRDIIECIAKDNGVCLKLLRADGGAAANDFLMQFQSDLLNKEILRPDCTESTALGAVYFSGLATGVFKDINDINGKMTTCRRFVPKEDTEKMNLKYKGWKKAVERAKNWED